MHVCPVRFEIAFLGELLVAEIAVKLGIFIALEFGVLVQRRHVFVSLLTRSAIVPHGIELIRCLVKRT